MKRLLVLLSLLFTSFTYADTITLKFLNEDNTNFETSSCTIGGNLEIPNTHPIKRGYTFDGWLPSNITRIEYLESNGYQYIDTGYRFNDNIKVVFKANWPVLGNYLFGANSNSGENFFVANGGYLMGVHFSFSPAIQSNTDTIIEMQMYKGDAYLKINDVTVAQNTSSSANDKPMYLFAALESGIAKKRMKIYYFKIYQNDILVRDFVPIVDFDGTPCMYDTVTQQFFYDNYGDPQGFITGPVIQ